jgi:hypothetical protein
MKHYFILFYLSLSLLFSFSSNAQDKKCIVCVGSPRYIYSMEDFKVKFSTGGTSIGNAYAFDPVQEDYYYIGYPTIYKINLKTKEHTLVFNWKSGIFQYFNLEKKLLFIHDYENEIYYKIDITTGDRKEFKKKDFLTYFFHGENGYRDYKDTIYKLSFEDQSIKPFLVLPGVGSWNILEDLNLCVYKKYPIDSLVYLYNYKSGETKVIDKLPPYMFFESYVRSDSTITFFNTGIKEYISININNFNDRVQSKLTFEYFVAAQNSKNLLRSDGTTLYLYNIETSKEEEIIRYKDDFQNSWFDDHKNIYWLIKTKSEYELFTSKVDKAEINKVFTFNLNKELNSLAFISDHEAVGHFSNQKTLELLDFSNGQVKPFLNLSAYNFIPGNIKYDHHAKLLFISVLTADYKLQFITYNLKDKKINFISAFGSYFGIHSKLQKIIWLSSSMVWTQNFDGTQLEGKPLILQNKKHKWKEYYVYDPVDSQLYVSVFFDGNSFWNTFHRVDFKGDSINLTKIPELDYCTHFSIYHHDPTDIDDVKEKQKLSLHPNPSNSILNLSDNIDLANVVQIEIVDVAGRKIKNVKIRNHQIDISDLTNGMYFVRMVSYLGETTSLPFIKQ